MAALSASSLPLGLVGGAWPGSEEELLVSLAFEGASDIDAWSATARAELSLDRRPEEFFVPADRGLRIDPTTEPGRGACAVHVPGPPAGGVAARVAVRVGTYGRLALRVGPADGGRTAEVEPTRNQRVDLELAGLASDTVWRDGRLRLAVDALERPVLVYDVEYFDASGTSLGTVAAPQELTPGGWWVDGNESARPMALPGRTAPPMTRALRVSPAGETFHVEVPCDAACGGLDLVRVQLGTPGFLRVAAAAVFADGTVVQSAFLERDAPGVEVTLEFDLSELVTSASVPTQLRLVFELLTDPALVYRVDLLRRPAASRLPVPELGPQHVVVGTESRRALGLVPGVELGGTLPDALAQGLELGTLELACDVSLPLRTSRADGGSDEITLEVLRGDEVVYRHMLPLANEWRTHRVPLQASELGARGAVAYRFSTERRRGALVGVPRVERVRSSRVDGPRTVVLITSDTHRGDHMGYSYAGGGLRTPFLDALAAGGTRFGDATSVTTITNPSHASMFTGLSVRDTGIVGNLVLLAERARTLAEEFEAAGFRTFASVSARHLQPWRSGFGQGFERFDSPQVAMTRDGRETLEHARRLLADVGEQDVFVWLHLFEAHAPYLAHEGFTEHYYTGDPYAARLPELPAEAQAEWDRRIRDAQYLTALYKGEVSYLDRLLEEHFAKEPRLRSAQIAFTADHGEALGERGHFWTHTVLFPATLRVPLLLNGPGVPAGHVVTAGVSNQDIGRTLLDLAGVAPARGAEGFPGRSFLDEDTLAAMATEPRYVIGPHGRTAGVFHGRWFLLLHLGANPWGREPDSPRHLVRLFDRVADPRCEHDVLEGHLEDAKRLRRALVRWLADVSPDGPLTGAAPVSAVAHADVAALGYAADESSAAGTALIDPACSCPQCVRFR